MADEYYESVRKQIKNAAGIKEGVDKQDIIWTVVEGVAAVIDGAIGTKFSSFKTPVGGVSVNGLETLWNLISVKGGKDKIATTPNPWFVFNGHDDPETKTTKNYLQGRALKGIGATAIAVVGAGVSTVSAVDVGGIIQHANASGSTVAHLTKLKAMSAQYKQSKTISNWIDLIIRMKAIKLGIRAGQLAGASIPVPLVGGVLGVVAAAVKIGAKLSMTKVCLATAADIHWRAYQEQVLSRAFGGGKGGKVGPASNILYELFIRRGGTRIFGQYDVDALVRESCGWMALADKILLI